MFSKKFRLPSHASFTSGVVKSNQFFTLRTVKNGLSYNRYGFVVSKRISALATQRNNVKRHFRAILENAHPSILQGYDLLFILKSTVRTAEKKDVEQSIFIELKRVGVKLI